MATRSFNARNGVSVGTAPTDIIDSTGNITAVAISGTGNLTINTNKFVVTGTTGDLNINAGKLTVTAASGNMTSAGQISAVGLVASGAIATAATGANTGWLDNNGSSTFRLRSLGTDISTQGGFLLEGARSNNTTITTVLQIDTAGNMTVPATYGNTNVNLPNMYVDAAGKFYRSTGVAATSSDALAFAIAL